MLLTALIPVGAAQAQTFYLGAEGGWTVLNNQNSNAAGFPTVNSRFDSGFAAGARVGYEMGPWRFEEEYAYRRNDLDRITAAGFSPAGVKGGRAVARDHDQRAVRHQSAAWARPSCR